MDACSLVLFCLTLGTHGKWERAKLSNAFVVRPPPCPYGQAHLTPGGAGSNVIVVSPELSGTGGALLANDMHLDASTPCVWRHATVTRGAEGDGWVRWVRKCMGGYWSVSTVALAFALGYRFLVPSIVLNCYPLLAQAFYENHFVVLNQIGDKEIEACTGRRHER